MAFCWFVFALLFSVMSTLMLKLNAQCLCLRIESLALPQLNQETRDRQTDRQRQRRKEKVWVLMFISETEREKEGEREFWFSCWYQGVNLSGLLRDFPYCVCVWTELVGLTSAWFYTCRRALKRVLAQ